MTNVIIIHGTEGNPNGNRFPWLKSELEKIGHRVFVPEFPTPENQSLQNRLNTFQEYEKYLDENSIIVGHSLGPVFLLNILEKLDHQIKGAFFVAGFNGSLNNPKFDELNKTFTKSSFDWNTIKNNCKRFFVINSDDDPYVPLVKGEELAKNLNTELIIIKNAGHINKESGYTKFEFLLEKMKEIL